jgi:hypothetical protein
LLVTVAMVVEKVLQDLMVLRVAVVKIVVLVVLVVQRVKRLNSTVTLLHIQQWEQ